MITIFFFAVEHKSKPIFRTDYTYIEASQAFYKMHTTPKNLADAKRVCALEGASLYYPEDTVEVKAVTEFWEKIQPSIPWVYIGISAMIAKGVFRTTDSTYFLSQRNPFKIYLCLKSCIFTLFLLK